MGMLEQVLHGERLQNDALLRANDEAAPALPAETPMPRRTSASAREILQACLIADRQADSHATASAIDMLQEALHTATAEPSSNKANKTSPVPDYFALL